MVAVMVKSDRQINIYFIYRQLIWRFEELQGIPMPAIGKGWGFVCVH